MNILLFDIENAPIITYAWGIHDDPMHSTKFVKEDWYIMCWAAKWLGKKKVHTESLITKKFDPKNPCDKYILGKLWKLLDEADIVIAHNGKKFDVRKANARFMQHGMPPPSPYRVIDTLIEARKHFMFTSNRLGDLGEYLGVGSKIDTGGFDLWLECMNGNPKAWRKMVKYCKQDVLLLERVYLKIRPYIKTHPNTSVIAQDQSCGRCGGGNLVARGFSYTQAAKKQRYQCMDCKGYGAYVITKKGEKKGTRNL